MKSAQSGAAGRIGALVAVLAALLLLPGTGNAAVTVSVPQTLIATASTATAVVVSLSGPSGTPVSVDYATSDGFENRDYYGASGTLTFAASETVKTISVPIPAGAVANSKFLVSLSNPSNGLTIGAGETTVSISSATNFPVVSIPTTLVATRAGNTLVTVILSSGPLNGRTTVIYSTQDATALAGVDYSSTSGTLIFQSNVTSQTISIPIANNYAQLNATTFTLAVTSASGGTLIPGSPLTVTIPAPASLLRVPVSLTGARAGNLLVPVARTGDASAATNVSYDTSDGTAVDGRDYTAVHGTLAFAAGQALQTISVPVLNNTALTAAAAFKLVLSNPPSDTVLGNASVAVTIPPAAPIRTSAIFSTAQSTSQSFLRFFNTSAAAGTVTATLSDYTTGVNLGQWTSPSIPAGAELQFAISDVETGAGITGNKPAYYTMAIQTSLGGYFQHVLYRPADGTLTNLSTCAAGVTADPASLSGVHSALLGSLGFPSSIAITNTGTTAETVTLGLYDARDGSKLGTTTTASIPAGGQLIPTVAALETAAHVSPVSGQYHYVVKAEGAFTGYLQHLVSNMQAGVVTDMTTSCALPGLASVNAYVPLQSGTIFSTAQSTSQSFLRFLNTGSSAKTVTVVLRDFASGQTLGTWTSPTIQSMSEQQFPISTVESVLAAGATKPAYYSIIVQPGMTGYFQHVLYRPVDGTLTNLSTCAAGVTADPGYLSGVHSSLLGDIGFPSSIAVTNTGTTTANVTLDVYDARTGLRVGSYASVPIPPKGQIIPTVAAIEAGAGFKPTDGMLHYVIKPADALFKGFLQHLVNNTKVGVITDMTTACALPLVVP